MNADLRSFHEMRVPDGISAKNCAGTLIKLIRIRNIVSMHGFIKLHLFAENSLIYIMIDADRWNKLLV